MLCIVIKLLNSTFSFRICNMLSKKKCNYAMRNADAHLVFSAQPMLLLHRYFLFQAIVKKYFLKVPTVQAIQNFQLWQNKASPKLYILKNLVAVQCNRISFLETMYYALLCFRTRVQGKTKYSKIVWTSLHSQSNCIVFSLIATFYSNLY